MTPIKPKSSSESLLATSASNLLPVRVFVITLCLDSELKYFFLFPFDKVSSMLTLPDERDRDRVLIEVIKSLLAKYPHK